MDQMLKDQYRDEPLLAEEAVRILVLEPADDFRSPLCCSITRRRRTIDALAADGCNYSAVSYTYYDYYLKFRVFEKKLRIICDPLYFQYSGVADLVIRPSTSRKFW
ncbi:hypothetical protein INS49_000317 [Diaporthe citri]|uniref:uncharacterized protein n=1 Tax=Diaporthe citri TaxID=83186 RepID=UPI001C80DFCB|nr:uncharacterized protein INS49_000317 [Diaporthe citri]KAG6366141.1 hypothetical protein INS49_000317 [Diaporthe citri]